ncbi:uncharacterized protein TNCV_3124151 [Trichonephila clavipes]|nr:uncharacterized protein TNCV_3124151 [Trichonephila clavipes]
MVSWDYLWPTLRCRREAGVSPLLLIGWWYLSSESPKRHGCRVSAADKGCRVYPLDPRLDAVAYSGCTLAIKTNRNISYLEARKLIAPQLSQTYAQVAKPSTVSSTTQTDENITQIKCPPLQLLQPLLSVPQPDKSNSVSTLSSATQADLLPSSSIAATISEPPNLIPVSNTLHPPQGAHLL